MDEYMCVSMETELSVVTFLDDAWDGSLVRARETITHNGTANAPDVSSKTSCPLALQYSPETVTVANRMADVSLPALLQAPEDIWVVVQVLEIVEKDRAGIFRIAMKSAVELRNILADFDKDFGGVTNANRLLTHKITLVPGHLTVTVRILAVLCKVDHREMDAIVSDMAYVVQKLTEKRGGAAEATMGVISIFPYQNYVGVPYITRKIQHELGICKEGAAHMREIVYNLAPGTEMPAAVGLFIARQATNVSDTAYSRAEDILRCAKNLRAAITVATGGSPVPRAPKKQEPSPRMATVEACSNIRARDLLPITPKMIAIEAKKRKDKDDTKPAPVTALDLGLESSDDEEELDYEPPSGPASPAAAAPSRTSSTGTAPSQSRHSSVHGEGRDEQELHDLGDAGEHEAIVTQLPGFPMKLPRRRRTIGVAANIIPAGGLSTEECQRLGLDLFLELRLAVHENKRAIVENNTAICDSMNMVMTTMRQLDAATESDHSITATTAGRRGGAEGGEGGDGGDGHDIEDDPTFYEVPPVGLEIARIRAWLTHNLKVDSKPTATLIFKSQDVVHVLKLMLKQDVEPQLIDKKGYTPVDLARDVIAFVFRRSFVRQYRLYSGSHVNEDKYTDENVLHFLEEYGTDLAQRVNARLAGKGHPATMTSAMFVKLCRTRWNGIRDYERAVKKRAELRRQEKEGAALIHTMLQGEDEETLSTISSGESPVKKAKRST